MTNTELNAFRATLESKLAELTAGGRNREALAIDTSPEELDRIQQAQDRELAIVTLDRHAKLLREVRAALGRLDDGSFGLCIGCDEEIKPKRLAAVPWASHCIACQEAADREQSAPWSDSGDSLEIAA
jgi:DnaK suppressor protein